MTERGADALRLEDVAANAGVSRQSIYLHFGSRSALFVAVVDHIDAELGLPSMLAEIEAAPTPREALARSLRVTARYATGIQAAAMALSRVRDLDPDADAAYETRMERRRTALRSILAELAKTGELRKQWSPTQAADALWSIGTPETYDALVVRRGWSVDDYERWLHHVAASFLSESAE